MNMIVMYMYRRASVKRTHGQYCVEAKSRLRRGTRAEMCAVKVWTVAVMRVNDSVTQVRATAAHSSPAV